MVARYFLALALGTALSSSLASPAAATDLGTVEGVRREAIYFQAAPGGVAPLWLEALVTRPDGPREQQVRYPLALLSHGTPRPEDDRRRTSPLFSTATAIEFALRGWTVVTLIRRGYGLSQGEFLEGTEPCNAQTDHRARANVTVQDITEATKGLSQLPYVDGSKLMLMGVSTGGFGSLAAAAENPPGLQAVLNFGGGRGSTGPNTVCQPDRLVETFGQLGAAVKVPTLWVYAENDSFFAPALAKRFVDAFGANGGKAQFVALPAVGREGNALFGAAAIDAWRSSVDQFLNENRLANWAQPVAINPLPLAQPPFAWDKSKANVEEFERYRTSLAFEKALAFNRDGKVFWRNGFRTPEDAAKSVMEQCQASGTRCRLYAVNHTVVQ